MKKMTSLKDIIHSRAMVRVTVLAVMFAIIGVAQQTVMSTSVLGQLSTQRASAQTAGVCGRTSTAPSKYKHVIWIWMENTNYSSVNGNAAAPYINTLVSQCGSNSGQKGFTSPSLPNYIYATSGVKPCGKTCPTGLNVYGDCMPVSATCHAPVDNIFRQVRSMGGTERSYEESMTANCDINQGGTYAAKHNPAAYYDAGTDRQACLQDDIPFGTTASGSFISALASDTTLPTFSFVTPNLCNDMHDCSVTTGDNWIKAVMPKIIASPAYQSGNTMVAVWWDEGSSGTSIIPNVVMSPSAKHVVINDSTMNHAALLRTTEDALGITSHLGDAASAPSFAAAYNLLGSGGPTPPPVAPPPPAPNPTPPPVAPPPPAPNPTPPPKCTSTTPPLTTFGQVKQSVTVTTAGTYRVWSRIKAPDTTNNSYYFQADAGCVYKVGDASSIPANTWTWVDYQSGTSTSKIDITLTAGTHNLTFTGAEPNVELDRVLLVNAAGCTPNPTGNGDDCADTVNPTISLTAPAANSTVNAGATINVMATANDNVAVTHVDFYVDGTMKGSDTTAPYSYAWNTTGLTGVHSISAQAFDASGNHATAGPISLTVKGTSTQPPPVPTPPPTPSGTLGDCAPANALDGHVNGLDLSAVVSHDGQNYAPCDFNHDQSVGAADLAIVFGHWTW